MGNIFWMARGPQALSSRNCSSGSGRSQLRGHLSSVPWRWVCPERKISQGATFTLIKVYRFPSTEQCGSNEIYGRVLRCIQIRGGFIGHRCVVPPLLIVSIQVVVEVFDVLLELPKHHIGTISSPCRALWRRRVVIDRVSLVSSDKNTGIDLELPRERVGHVTMEELVMWVGREVQLLP